MIVRREKARGAQSCCAPYPASVRRAFFMAAALSLLFSLCACVEPAVAEPARTNSLADTRSLLAGFDAFVTDALKQWAVPGLAIAIVKDGRIVYAKGFGLREVGKKLPVTTNTLFAIGSTTKAFTTFVMGTLVDEGKLDWDKPVRRFLPDFRLYDQNATELITPRDLVTHRSGLPRHDLVWYNNTAISRRELVERLAYLEPSATLRAKFQYNNLMYAAAGYLVEHLTGQSWEENVRRRIFDPLGMTNSNFSVRDSQQSPDYALPYREKDDQIEPMRFRNIDLIGPAGSINSSVSDMSKWLVLNLNHGRFGERTLINPATLADIHSPHMPVGASVDRPEISQGSYALGWVIDTYRGRRRLSHGGGIDGFITLVTLLPDDNLGLVVFANLNETSLPTVLTRHAIDRLLKIGPIDWNGEALGRRSKGKQSDQEAKTTKQSVRKAGTKPAHQLQDYAGQYEHPGYGVLKVELRGDKLAATFNDITTALEHWHYEIFNAPDGAADDALENMKFNFQTDLDGNVASVSIPLAPQVKEIVFAKKPDARLSDPSYLGRFTGDYDYSGYTMTVSRQGNILTLSLPGEPQYQLRPGLDGGFTLKELSSFGLRFVADDSGKIIAASISRPNGVVTAKRKGAVKSDSE